MKRIVFSDHANKRMKESRQDGIEYEDVYAACNLAKEILFKGVPLKIKLGGFTAKSGFKFDFVIVDKHLRSGEVVLSIITVIGARENKAPGLDLNGYRFPNGMPYKKRRKILNKLRKKERKFIEQSISRYRKHVRNTEERRQGNQEDAENRRRYCGPQNYCLQG